MIFQNKKNHKKKKPITKIDMQWLKSFKIPINIVLDIAKDMLPILILMKNLKIQQKRTDHQLHPPLNLKIL